MTELADRPATRVPAPGPSNGVRAPRDPAQLLDDAWRTHRARAAGSPVEEQVEPVADTTEVGYEIRGNEARLVPRREVLAPITG